MSNICSKKLSKALIALLVALAIFTSLGSLGSKSFAEDPSSQEPNIPSLVGTWDLSGEFYEASRFSPGTYDAGDSMLVITEQIGPVFTGYQCEDPNDDHGSVNGAIVGNSIRIGGYDLTMTGLLDPNTMEIVGTYNNLPLDLDDNDFETGIFVARKRLE